MLAPSQMRRPRAARRRSGGFVRITNAAATPADASTTFATVRAVVSVTIAYEFLRDPEGPEDGLRVGSDPLPRTVSLEDGEL